MAGAQGQLDSHSHMGASRSPGTAPLASVRQQGAGLSLNVASLNNSGITGTAVLRAIEVDKTEVEIFVNGAGAGPQPAHVHEGACADLNPVPKIPLSDLANGVSATQLDESLQPLMSAPHAIFLHKSLQELPVFVACADIMVAGQLSAVPVTGGPDTWFEAGAGLVGLGLALAGAGAALRHRARRARASTRT
jgi:hypothetical protein